MRIAIIIAALGVCVASDSWGQQATVRRMSVAKAGTVNLSQVDDKYQAEVYNLEMPSPDGNPDKVRLRQVKEQVSKQFPRRGNKAAYKTTVAPSPTVGMSYVADVQPGIPPDNDMAISLQNSSVSVMNSRIAIHNAQTGTPVTAKSLKSMTSTIGLNGVQYYRYDPKVIYDPEADRFICVMLNNTDAENWIILGFSKTNDPAGLWNFYKLYGNYANDTTWFDYPSIAITHSEFFLTGNKIKFNTSWQAGFTQTVIYQINKQDGYNGDTLSTQLWENTSFGGRNIRNLYPVKGGASIKGPEQYFLSNRNFDVQNDTIFLVKIPDTIGSVNLNLTVTPLVSNLTYGVPPNGRQPDTSYTLATNDARVLGAYIENDEIQFTSTTVHPVSGASAVYHGKITNVSTSPSVQASLFSIDTLDFGYPNLSFAGPYNGAKSSIISFNYTGPNKYPGMGAIYYDGTQFSDMVDIKTGDSSINQLPGKEQRWGDYMGSQQDWSGLGSVWVLGIYGRTDKDYGNFMAKLTSPYPNSVKDNLSPSGHSRLYPNPVIQYIKLDFELEQPDDVKFAIYDLQGRKVDELLENRCKAGKNRIQFNVGSLPKGNYFLKGHTSGGREVMVKPFIKG
jgi:hypothetical protein